MKSDDFNSLSHALGLTTARTPEGLSESLYREIFLEAFNAHGAKMVDALVVLSRIFLKDASTAMGLSVDQLLQYYGLQFKRLEMIADKPQ